MVRGTYQVPPCKPTDRKLKNLLVTAPTDLVTAGRRIVGLPTENGWGTVSIGINGNKGRYRGGSYLRILPFSSSLFFFAQSIPERTSG